MSRSVLRCLSLCVGLAGVALPVCLSAAEREPTPEGRIRLVIADDPGDPDEGLPGGTVRLAIPRNEDTPAAAPTAQEKKAVDAAAPQAEHAEEAKPPAEKEEAVPRLNPELERLRAKVRTAMATYYPKHLNTRDNSSWEVMHAIIAFGVDTKINRGSSRGEEVNAITWLCYNGACRGEHLFYLNGNQMAPRRGPGLQGHWGQFLAIIAQSHVKSDYPMNISGRYFTLKDLIEHEQADCRSGEELTFKLIGLMHYLDSDAAWFNREGQPWSIQRLVREELAQPIRGAACGGTHRLMGLSYAVNKRIQRGQPINGEFQRAQKFINEYHRYTFSLQNPDGSFSTEWFVRKDANPEIDRRVRTTGHIAEWLSFSLSEDELQQPQMIKAVDYLSGILIDGKDHTWEIGPLGHALHALRIYDRRVFKPLDPKADPPVASTAAAEPKPTVDRSAEPTGDEDRTAAAPGESVRF